MSIENTRSLVDTEIPSGNENFRLIIEGLGWVFKKNDKWKIWFPKAPDHDLKVFVWRGIGAQNTLTPYPNMPMILEPGHTITIDHKANHTFQGPPVFGEHIFKIDKPDYHKNVKLKPNATLMNKASVLNLKDTEMTPVMIKKRFRVIKNRTPTNTYLDLGFAIKGFLRVEHGSENAHTKINIKEKGGGIKLDERLEYSSGGSETYTILISNHCNKPECLTKSDFVYYYNIIDGNSTDGNRYDLEYIPRVLGDSKTEKSKVDVKRRGLLAPCNVIYSGDDPEGGG